MDHWDSGIEKIDGGLSTGYVVASLQRKSVIIDLLLLPPFPHANNIWTPCTKFTLDSLFSVMLLSGSCIVIITCCYLQKRVFWACDWQHVHQANLFSKHSLKSSMNVNLWMAAHAGTVSRLACQPYNTGIIQISGVVFPWIKSPYQWVKIKATDQKVVRTHPDTTNLPLFGPWASYLPNE